MIVQSLFVLEVSLFVLYICSEAVFVQLCQFGFGRNSKPWVLVGQGCKQEDKYGYKYFYCLINLTSACFFLFVCFSIPAQGSCKKTATGWIPDSNKLRTDAFTHPAETIIWLVCISLMFLSYEYISRAAVLYHLYNSFFYLLH